MCAYRDVQRPAASCWVVYARVISTLECFGSQKQFRNLPVLHVC